MHKGYNDTHSSQSVSKRFIILSLQYQWKRVLLRQRTLNDLCVYYSRSLRKKPEQHVTRLLNSVCTLLANSQY